ncbi:SUMO-conjugating enzyme UBC9-B isoform X2 [Nematostella vectensis]|uniref:SUMO-conjugating enzyme UBC9-B isoform X2 n=1 Tax=Nematostella vectensis TaxID=45351 RepID=UPI00138FE140|nr:SUMO-conjugating enzyme UBC9-B isoform X2 [Nematostella vectensis]
MAAKPKVDPIERLKEEHKAWGKTHPRDFIANPKKLENGEIDWLTWKCAIPGPKKTPWEGGLYPITLEFPHDYPHSPPKCVFDPPILHPNVFTSGTVCLSLIDKNKDWKPQVTAQQVLTGIQLLLADPNFQEPAQAEAFVIYTQSRLDYENKVKQLAMTMQPESSPFIREFLGSVA